MQRTLLLALAVLAAAPVRAADLKDALEKAWARHPAAQAQLADQAALRARADAAAALLPAAPTASLLYRGDELTERDGQREWEGELGFPLWLPGERRAAGDLVQQAQRAYGGSLAQVRLELAGELREALWRQRLAAHGLALAQERLEVDRRLRADVRRRVDAGELARADLLLIEDELAAAEVELAAAQAELATAAAALRRLTGEAAPPADIAEAPAQAVPLDSHPALAAAAEQVTLAQAQLRLARQQRRDRPELAVGITRERDEYGAGFDSSVSLKLTLPLATRSRNQPLITAAHAELERAEAAYRSLRRRLDSELASARAELAAAEAAERAVQRRAALAQEQLALSRRAFDLGERDLLDLLRIQATALESLHAQGRAVEILHRARARLNQAQGVSP